jgi:hypothetical protein
MSDTVGTKEHKGSVQQHGRQVQQKCQQAAEGSAVVASTVPETADNQQSGAWCVNNRGAHGSSRDVSNLQESQQLY